MSDETILKGHDVFASLTVDEINTLSTFSSVKEFSARDVIFENDLAAFHVYILMEGLVYLQLPAKLPEFTIPISKVEKGEMFGISPLLGSPRYTLAAQCYKDTKALAIETEPFLELLQQNRLASQDIMTRVANIYFARYLDIIKRMQNIAG